MGMESGLTLATVVEFCVAGGCIGAMYSAGQAGQPYTALFAGTTILALVFERKYRIALHEARQEKDVGRSGTAQQDVPRPEPDESDVVS